MADLQPGTFSIETEKWPYDPTFQDFATFLGLNSKKDGKGTYWDFNDKTVERIKELYRWGIVNAKSVNPEEVKYHVFKLIKETGVNWVGETLVDKLWQHIQFDTNYKQKLDEVDRQIKSETSDDRAKEVQEYLTKRDNKEPTPEVPKE